MKSSFLFESRPLLVALAISALGHLALLTFRIWAPVSVPHQAVWKVQLTILENQEKPAPTPSAALSNYSHEENNSSGELTRPPPDQPVPDESSLPAAMPTEVAKAESTSYLRSDQVDETAIPVEVAPLIYPEDPFIRKIPGNVKVRIFINEAGVVDSVDVLDADPPGLFEKSAIDSILETKFRAARLFGIPVRNVKTVEIRFDPYRDQPVAPAVEPQVQP